MEYLKTVFDRKHIKLLISAGISLIVGLIVTLVSIRATGKIDSQQFAKRWCGDNSYAQVSAFFSELSGFSEDQAKELAYKIEAKLRADSISNPDSEGRLWVYSYSANGEVTASSHNSSAKVKAIGVGGDFFLFHPFEVLEGAFFSGDDIMKDYAVIDEDTAWTLFGSNDVVGQIIEIGGVRHVVTGVIKKDDSRLDTIGGNDQPTIYLSYESLANNGTVTYINTYEALMPNPLTGYALDTLKASVTVDENRFEAVENSERFHWTRLIKNVKNFGIRGMNGKGIVYPFWENIARGYEDYLTPVTMFGIALYSYAFVITFFCLIRMWKKRTIHKEEIIDFIERWIEYRRERRKQIEEGIIYEED